MNVGPGQAITIAKYVAPETCAAWLAQLEGDRPAWLTYFDFIHSYGRAWYLDIEAGQLNQYYEGAMRTNSALAKVQGLLESLRGAARYLIAPDGSSGLPCRARHENLGPYWSEAGVVRMTDGRAGQVHADYEGLAPYPAALFNQNTRAYSAVLSLFKAELGGNLKIWCKRRLGNEAPDLEDFTVQILDYAPGNLALFDSFCYHQILASQLTEAQSYRAVAAVHFLYVEAPYPHWEYWF
jgi:hypothetical protein